MDLSYAKQIVYSIFKKARQKAYSTTNVEAPQTWKQVLKSLNRAKWLQAIYSEFEQIILQNILEFWPDSKLLEGRKPITSRLVLREKKDENNRVFKFKA
jgi:DNA-binding ferritin-like protein (Dps family)